MNTTETLSTLRTQLAERRMIRQRNRRLEEELASYSSPAERLELDAILSRHTAEEIAELEGMLNRQALTRTSHL
jgi:hypothetical protein